MAGEHPRYQFHVGNALHAAGMMGHGRTVVIWQADGGVGHRLEFMYKPVMDSLVDAFSDVPPQVIEVVGKPKVVHGFGAFRVWGLRGDGQEV